MPSRASIDRILTRLNGDALGVAVGAYLADRHRAQTTAGASGPRRQRRIIAVDGKALKGSARFDRQRRHLLSAVVHGLPVTIAQAEVGSETNETALQAPVRTAGSGRGRGHLRFPPHRPSPRPLTGQGQAGALRGGHQDEPADRPRTDQRPAP